MPERAGKGPSPGHWPRHLFFIIAYSNPADARRLDLRRGPLIVPGERISGTAMRRCCHFEQKRTELTTRTVLVRELGSTVAAEYVNVNGFCQECPTYDSRSKCCLRDTGTHWNDRASLALENKEDR